MITKAIVNEQSLFTYVNRLRCF